MGKTVEIIENSVVKKKKFNRSKNKKKTWRKIQHKDVDEFLQQQEADERLGVLGEDTSNFLTLDYDPNDLVKETKPLKGPLRYTVDPATGLKATGCTKKDEQAHKEVKELTFVNKGLPGKKPINKASRFRVQHTKEHKDALRKARLQRTPKLAAKIAERRSIDEETARKSSILKKQRRRMPGEDVWAEAEPEQDAGKRFIAAEMDYTLRTLKKLPVKRRQPPRPNAQPALPIPDPGLSYQPTEAAYSRLLLTAAAKESKRLANLRRDTRVKSANFPLGALPANELHAIVDMAPQDGGEETEAPHYTLETGETLGAGEAQEPAPVIAKPGRLTHQQKMKKKKRSTRRQDEAKLAKRKQMKDQWDSLEASQQEVEKEAARAKRRRAGKDQRRKHAAKLPARFTASEGVEVALPSELSSSLRGVTPSSNPVSAAFDSVFRRGLLPAKPKRNNRAGRSVLRLPPTRRVRGKTIARFEAHEFGIKL